MKRILTILAIFMSVICGSVFLVSCGDGYKKMYLQVEYAVYDDDGKFDKWVTVKDGKLDYTMSSNLYSSDHGAHILNLRVKVKGTSKKVDSIYVSQSATTAVSLEDKNVKPNEAFTVLVHNIGSVSFNMTPSEGGEDKSVEFKLNIYRELTDIEQNVNCVPAVVVGGNVKLDALTNLIKYHPFDEETGDTQTNQTGVDYELVAVGKLDSDDEKDLLERNFTAKVSTDSPNEIKYDGRTIVELLRDNSGNLILRTDTRYALTSENNVIKLLARSKHDSEETAVVYVFIVEYFKEGSLLVSYHNDIYVGANDNWSDKDGNILTGNDLRTLGEKVVIYDALLGSEYKYVDVYAYTSRSIYSFVSEPDISMKVYVNGVLYNYKEIADSNIGIKISPVTIDKDKINSVGLRFETNPFKADDNSEYRIKLELDFTAFDFSASAPSPVQHLKKEFTLKVESLASSFSINGKPYEGNFDASKSEVKAQNITYYNSNKTAVIYSQYVGSLGMPLNIKAVPSNAEDVDVYTSFYSDLSRDEDTGELDGTNISDKFMLSETANSSLKANAKGEFVFTRQYANRQVYLRFADGKYDSSIKTVYMVCKVRCTPTEFNGETIAPKYITFIAKFDVVGAASAVNIYKKDETGMAELNDTYLENGKQNLAYIGLSGNTTEIDLGDVTISSEGKNVKFSADSLNWTDDIKLSKLKLNKESNRYELYFRSIKQCDENILINASNGLNAKWSYSFVNVTGNADGVKVEYEDTYIWTSKTEDTLYYQDGTNPISVKYLALQDGATAQFMARGDGKTANIASLRVNSLLKTSSEYLKIVNSEGDAYYPSASMTSYLPGAVKIPPESKDTYLFDIRANTIGFTSIVFVAVDFYVEVDKTIIPQTKYFIFEIAVYVPAKDLSVTTDKEQILFVNEHYMSAATVEFAVSNNASATSRIAFSSNAVNNEVYKSYGETGYNSIYGICVNTTIGFESIMSAGFELDDYFSIVGLNKAGEDFVGRSGKFTLTALKDLKDLVDKGIQSVFFDFEIHQFGEETVHTARKVIYFGDYTKVDGILVGGVDNYSNLYISLWDAVGGVTKQITAEPTNKDATYKELDYKLKKVKLDGEQIVRDEDRNIVTEEMDDEDKEYLEIQHPDDSNIFNITAKIQGGVYLLTIFAKDSHDGTKYAESTNILITVSDGKTDATAYLISKYEDFIKIDFSEEGEDLHYRLASDNIDLSALYTKPEDWWTKKDANGNVVSRMFNGHLDGSMTISDPNTGVSITKRFPLKNLSITNDSSKNNSFALFSSLAEGASIRNVIFDNVSIKITLDAGNTANAPIHIGVIAGINNGIIENCSIKLASSEVRLKKATNPSDDTDYSAQNTTYNIGLVVGINNKTILYDNQQSSDYAYMLDCASQGKLDVVVEAGNPNLKEDTNIYVGGIAGNNASGGKISSTYEDLSDQSLRTLITGVVNIDVLTEYKQGTDPMTINSIGIGGAVGYNAGTVSQVAISGSIAANDGFNMGGVIGINAGTVYECANYGMVLKGYSLNDDLSQANKYTTKTLKYYGTAGTDELVLEQNIGGIIGYNNTATKVENVRTLFMEFEAGYVTVASAESYIKGVGNVAGVIGKASSNTQLIRGNVENFIINEEGERTYNIIGAVSYIYYVNADGTVAVDPDNANYANIAGLIASGSGAKAYLSFVQADFDINKAIFNEFGNGLAVNYTYFVGDVLADSGKLTDNELTTHQSATGNNYIVNNIIYTDDGKEQVNVKLYNVDAIALNSKDDTSISDYTVVWNKGEGINNDYPYLAYIVEVDEKDKIIPTLTIQPNEIIVNVDKDYYEESVQTGNYFQRYIKDENAKESGIYMQYLVAGADTPDDTSDDKIKATAIVYYNEKGNNEYKLLTEQNEDKTWNYGLIEKTILPAITNGGAYTVTDISEDNIATLKDGDNTIEFRGAGKVVLKFTSAYNKDISDTVVIFVESPLHDDTFDVQTSAGISVQGSDYSTNVGKNPTLSIKLKDVDGQTFDSTKLYMTYTVGTAKDNNKEDVVNNEYFTLSSLSKEIATGKYLLGDLQLATNDLPDNVQYITIPVTINVYLNLAKYEIDDKTLGELLTGVDPRIVTRTINIKVYNKATGLTLSNDVKTEAGTGVDIVASLQTGYIDIKNGNPSALLSGENSLYPSVSNAVISGQDYVYAKLSAVNENASKLLDEARLNAENAGKNYNAWDIFNIIITYTTIDNGGGYKYNFNLRLKDEYRDLNLDGFTEKEWKFNVEIIAGSNTDLRQNVMLSFVPQTLTTFRIENYSYLVARTALDNTSVVAEFVSSETESSMIVPGESGLLKIYAESDYAYFDNIKISSSVQEIDGQQYFVRFQQMVYDRENKVYRSYAGVTADGETLQLAKRSYINADGSYEYTGVIFVRTILDNIVGVRKTFTFNVTAKTYDIDGKRVDISRDKTVLSQYKPGVYIDVENAIESTYGENVVYLVEKGSSNVTVAAKVYGYEFNVVPTRYLKYLDGSEVSATDVTLIESEITQDSDGAFIIKYTLSPYTAKPFKLRLDMTLTENGNSLVGKSSELIFYPVPYIIKNVHLKGEVDNTLSIPINSSKAIDMVWSTISTTETKRDNINTNIFKKTQLDADGNPVLLLNDEALKMFYFKAFDSNGRVYDQTLYDIYANDTDQIKANTFGFKIEKTDDAFYIRALNKNSITIYFDLYYKYVLDDESTIEFSYQQTAEFKNKFSYTFLLNFVVKTEENAPKPIYKASELQEMSEDEHYILMNDIYIRDSWTPITAAIGSLDGNGKKIVFVAPTDSSEQFNITVQTNTNVGLFATIGANTIVKNVAIDISSIKAKQYIKNDSVADASINFGILAGVNLGLIYNCEVISVGKASSIELVLGAGYNLIFGGLVGQNRGNITNSRVGTEYFEHLTLDAGNNPISRIEKCQTISFKSRGIMAGFVGRNDSDCIISSCYVANTSIENTSNAVVSKNKTAGFVAENAGTVAYSYSKGLENSILNTQSRATVCKIYASGLGSVAGFVYTNTGTVHDCYSNIECESTSSAVAGFVYDASQGQVYQCYSASKVTVQQYTDGLATRLPFVGIGVETTNAKQLLSNENMINCYYLDDDTVEYDENYIVPEGAIEPIGIDLTTFADSNSLNNFAFITNGTQEQQLNAVWTYSTAIDRNKSTFSLGITSLPELTAANRISRSLRTEEFDAYGYLKQNNYANGYAQGTAKNPYIVRNVSEYNSVFVEGIENRNMAGYVRFVDHISFKDGEKYIEISTRSNYTLGDKGQKTFTLIDGNGMTISDVMINYTKGEEGTLGLFSKVEYALIKGLNISYASDLEIAGSTQATAVGGLAGVANNTYFIDINLTGGGNELRAHNIIGGVVGVLTGTGSGLYNITSDLIVASGANGTDVNDTWIKTEDYSELSYAGGIVGVVDDASTKIYLNKLQVDGASVRADRAGGIAGYLGANVSARRLTYFIPATSQSDSNDQNNETATIAGRLVAGGVVAENKAEIKYSQATVEIDTQYEFDKAFADYINSGEEINAKDDADKNANYYTNHALDNSDGKYGNLNAVASQNLAGGFVGYNYGGTIQDCMTKANIGASSIYGNAQTIGGFVGEDIGGRYRFVYAQNYLDLAPVENKAISIEKQVVGGFAGIMSYENADVGKDVVINNVVVMTFYDKAQLWEVHQDESDDNIQQNTRPVDYIVGSINNSIALKSGEEALGTAPIINYGTICLDILTEVDKEEAPDKEEETPDGEGEEESDGDEETGDTPTEPEYQVMPIEVEALKRSVGAGSKFSGAHFNNMRNLYNLQAEDQKSIFESLFINWDTNYWDLDNTKFMPNLRVDNAPIFIEIKTGDDLQKFVQNPDGNFILMNNVEVGQYGNYVLDIDFTGILIGKLQPGGANPKFTAIEINADINRHTGAGFFRQTTGARISNVDFQYNKLSLNGDGDQNTVDIYGAVGGVTSIDTYGGKEGKGSRFENIAVTGNDTEPSDVNGNAQVASLGSIVGNSERSTLISCQSTLNYDINASSSANIGGLIGTINGKEEIDEKVLFSGLISASTYSGSMKVTGNGFNVGGIVSDAQYTYIQSCNALILGEDNRAISVELFSESEESNTNYFGGIVANSDQVAVIYCGALIDIQVNVAEDDTYDESEATYFIGGLVAQENNSGMEVIGDDINNSYAMLNANIENLDTLCIGGISSEVTEINTQFTSVVSNLSVQTSNVDNVIIGGIIGSLTGDNGEPDEPRKTINKSVAYLDQCNIAYNSSLIGGGLIGQTSVRYLIENSMSIGQLWANCSTDQITPSSTPSITILGGMVGLAGSLSGLIPDDVEVAGQKITNSYTVLTMSTANVYKGTIGGISHNVYTKSIVGYTTASVDTTNVLYSSDYTLAFEDETTTKFTSIPINVTANILMTNASTLTPGAESDIKGKIGSDWSWSDERLPVPLNSIGLLESANLGLTEGSAFKPYRINYDVEWDNYVGNVPSTEQAHDTAKYNYVALTYSPDNNKTTNFGDFNGVLLGNDMRINLTNASLFDNLQLHSAVSNVVVTLNGEYGSSSGNDNRGGIAQNNYGTIFMCGVQYTDLVVDGNFGGITNINYGTIAYCYNSGIAKSVDTSSSNAHCGGLVGTNNSNASIEYSYFTGNLNSSNTIHSAAISYGNLGYIANCYSAGQAGQGVVGTLMADYSRYENNYFDYYATFVTSDDYGTDDAAPDYVTADIIGKSTEEMQAGTSNSSSLLEGWLVYGMVTNGYKFGEVAQPTYNYGYPIHNFNQYKYDSGVKKLENEKRAKYTGNGTFIKIESVSDEESAKSKCAGKLVKELDTVWYDNSSYLINNLGLLDYISKVQEEKGTAEKYFELENSIIVPEDAEDTYYLGPGDKNHSKLLIDWQGISNFEGIFAGAGDMASGEEYYELDTTLQLYEAPEGTSVPDSFGTTLITKVDEANVKVIANLRGNALFASVAGNAVITGIKMLNSVTNNSTLISSIGNVDGSANAIIYNITISGGIEANASNNLSGLAGSVLSNSSLGMHSITYNNVEFKPIAEKTASSVAGVINSNEGTITIYSAINFVSQAHIDKDWTNAISGFIGNNNKGDIVFIQSSSVEITINSDKQINSLSGFATSNSGGITGTGTAVKLKGKLNAKTIAGVASSMSGGDIGGLNVEFENSKDDFKSEILGGAIATLSGGSLGNTSGINIKLTHSTTNMFGGVIAEVAEPGGGSINDVTLDTAEITIRRYNNALTAGLIIGSMDAVLSNINYTLESEIKFDVQQFSDDNRGLTADATAYGGGVGGVIGKSSVGAFTFKNEQPSMVTIRANANVGGFIGLYTGTSSLSFTSNDGDTKWPIASTTAYAQIDTLSDKQNEESNYYANNLGGIIGKWAPETAGAGLSPAILTAGTDEDDKIINNNPVLTSDDDKIKFNYNGKYCIYNVGGIVGFSTAGISNATNNAPIGDFDASVNDQGISNIVYGRGTNPSINKINKFINVGGIAGKITGENSLSYLTSEGAVDGMYCVGGIVGCAETITDVDKCTSSADIVGLAYVGGILGAVTSLESTSDEKTSTAGNIYGVVNVGGLAGYASKLEMKAYNGMANIYGNFNVGGVAGSVGTLTLSNSTTTYDTAVAIYGSVYDHKIDNKYYSFLPTNIGGIAGYISGDDDTNAADGSTTSPIKLENVTSYTTIKTDENVVYIDEDGNNDPSRTEYITIGMDTARFAKQADSITFTNIKPEDVYTHISGYYTDSSNEVVDAVKSENADSGIGGFIGKIDATVDFNDSYACGDIYAPYGINVGGVIGFTSQTISSLPNLSDTTKPEVYVAGSLFVGGYIGKCNGFDAGEIITIEADKNNINIQKTQDDKILTANCVGGIIGYSTGIVKGINLTGSSSNIKIFNSNNSTVGSGYMGVIVGRLDTVASENADMEDCSVSPGLCDAASLIDSNDVKYYRYNFRNEGYTIKGIIQNPDVFNYGGLVGLVDVAEGSTGTDVAQIIGTHYYPFTVDMVQNQDYADGKTKATYTGDDVKTLSLIAHYVNQSNLTISPSMLTSLYNCTSGGSDPKTNDPVDHNPINPNTKGWAKEYTMFRMMARRIPQDEPTGDSIQVIYNASYITHVDREIGHAEFTDSDEVTYTIQINSTINYTVYQPLNQTARLYCARGIATYFGDPDEDVDLNQDGEINIKKAVPVDAGKDANGNDVTINITDGPICTQVGWKEVDLLGDKTTGGGDDHLYRHCETDDLNIKVVEGGHSKDEFIARYFGIEADGTGSYIYYDENLTLGYSWFKVDDYLGADSGFMFETVFGDWDEAQELTDYESHSGSIFEVSGRCTGINITLQEWDDDLWDDFWANFGIIAIYIASAILIVAAVAVAVVSYGSASGLSVGMVALAGSLLAGGLAGWYIFAPMATNAYEQVRAVAQAEVAASYNNIQTSSYGALSPIYSRKVNYVNGQGVLNDCDESILIPVAATMIKEDGSIFTCDETNANQHFGSLLPDSNENPSEYNLFISLLKQGKITLPLSYFAVSSANISLSDINAICEIERTELDGGSNSNWHALGITKFQIPKYYKLDNELYVYAGAAEYYNFLYPTYNDSGMEDYIKDASLKKDIDIVNISGYAYVASNIESSATLTVINDTSAQDYIKNTYDIQTSTTRNIWYTIKEGSGIDKGFSSPKVTLSNLRWNFTENAVAKTDLDIPVAVKETPDGNRFTAEAYYSGTEFKGYKTHVAEPDASWEVQDIYLGDSGELAIGTSGTLTTYATDGSEYTSGMTNEDVYISGNYCYTTNYAENELIEPGDEFPIKISRTYYLAGTEPKDHIRYINPQSVFISYYDDSGNKIKYSLKQSGIDEEDFNSVKDKGIASPFAMGKVGDYYEWREGKVMQKVTLSNVFKDSECDLYYAQLVVGDYFGSSAYTYNKYVYRYDVSNIIYTRYYYGDINIMKPEGQDVMCVTDFLFDITQNNLLFAESCRFTLSNGSDSADEVKAYTSINSSKTIGKIRCHVPWSTDDDAEDT